MRKSVFIISFSITIMCCLALSIYCVILKRDNDVLNHFLCEMRKTEQAIILARIDPKTTPDDLYEYSSAIIVKSCFLYGGLFYMRLAEINNGDVETAKWMKKNMILENTDDYMLAEDYTYKVLNSNIRPNQSLKGRM